MACQWKPTAGTASAAKLGLSEEIINAAREQIVEAAKAARVHRFITSLPEGYDTVLTDEGAGISKGQRQLLAIARCFLTEADVVILDEAFHRAER